jgi:hypothetical protein
MLTAGEPKSLNILIECGSDSGLDTGGEEQGWALNKDTTSTVYDTIYIPFNSHVNYEAPQHCFYESE